MVKIGALGRRRTSAIGSFFLVLTGTFLSFSSAARKIGDSVILERTIMPMTSSTKDSRNGTRQPQDRNSSCGRTAAKVPSTNVPSAAPVGAPALVKDAAK